MNFRLWSDFKLKSWFSLTAIKVEALKINHIPLLQVDMIIYPNANLSAGLSNLSE